MATKIWIGGTASHTTEPGTAANWSPSGVPVDTNSIIVPASAAYNMDGYDFTATGTIQLHAFTVEEGCTITIGSESTPVHIDLKDDTTYYNANLGGTGKTYLKIDNADTVNITAAASASTGEYGLTLTGQSESASPAKVNVRAASNQKISIGTSTGGGCRVNAITVAGGNVTIQSGAVKSDGSSAPDLTISGGEVTSSATLGTVNKYGGTFTTLAGAITTSFTDNGGTTYHKSNGTIAAGSIGGSAIFDCSLDLRAKTITSFTVQGQSATYKDPNKVITNTNPIQLKGGAKPSQLDLGTDCGIVRS